MTLDRWIKLERVQGHVNRPHLRNAFVNSARQSIADARVMAKLETNRPLWEYKYKEAELAAQGYSGDVLHKKMIEDALNVTELKLEVKHIQCFPAGTLVHTDKGLVPIQNVKVGDMVLSRPEWGGKDAPTEYKRVTRAFCSGNDTIVQIPYIRESNPDLINIVYMTDSHPVWLEDKKEWIAAIDLVTSDKLSFIDNTDFAYVWKPSEVFMLKTNDESFYGYCDGITDSLKYGNSILQLDNGELRTLNIDDYGYSEEKYVDSFRKIDISGNTLLTKKYEKVLNTQTKFEVPVYNLEVEDFHTYFIGIDGLWVHNDNCFYAYLPNIAK